MGDKLSEMLGNQTLATVKERKLTKEEAERKAAILAQYSQVSDGEEYPCLKYILIVFLNLAFINVI